MKVASGNNGKGFGVNVWWTCPEVIRDGVLAQDALKKFGFEPSEMPLPSRRTEVSRAAYSFQNRMGKSNRRVTEKANDNVNYVTYGILDREQEEADTVGFTQHTTIRLDKDTDEVQVEGSLADAVMNAIKTYSGKITDDDIRAFLRRVIKMSLGVAKRPTGGIYFVPELAVHVVRSAQGVLDELQTGAKLYIEGVVNGVQERRNVWESVEEDIERQITETLSAVERIEKRTNAIKDHEEKLNGVKKLMDVYVGLLGEEAKYQGLTEKYEAAVKTVSEKLAEVQKGTAAVLPVKAQEPKPLKQAAMPPPPLPVANPAVKTNRWISAMKTQLEKAGTPMHFVEATKKAIADGTLQTEGKTPERNVYFAVSQSIKNGEGLFKALGKGMFALA